MPACTLNKINNLNAVTAVVATPATSATVDAAEVFTITPTVPGERLMITCSAAATHGTVNLSVAAGGFVNAATALALAIPQATTQTFQLDSSKYLSGTGVFTITATPAAGKRLLTDHVFTMTVIENRAI